MGSALEKEKVVAFVPVRGGSRSIPLKNVALLAGRPLVYWVAKACSECAEVAETFVGTDSEAIRCAVEEMDLQRVRVIGRSPETATDTASTESALLEFARSHDFGHVALIQATSPLLTSSDVDGAIRKYFESRADSLLTVVRMKRFLWQEEDGQVRAVNYDPLSRPMRQQWQGELVENGALYLTSRERLLATGCRLSGRIAAYEMPEDTFEELDEPADWLVVEQRLLARRCAPLALTRAAAATKVFCVDVDGTLTDGGMYYTDAGEVMKRFNTRDAMGMARLRERGIRLAIVTSEDSPIVLARARKLNIPHVFVGVKDKAAVLEGLLKDLGLGWGQLAYVGDDLNDLPVIRKAGFSACPADAAPEVARSATYLCKAGGGRGAVREVCNLILTALEGGTDVPRAEGGTQGRPT